MHTSISLSHASPHSSNKNNIAIINEERKNTTVLSYQQHGDAMESTSGSSAEIVLNSASPSSVSSSVNSAVLPTVAASALNTSSSKRSATIVNASEQKSSSFPVEPVLPFNSGINSTDQNEIQGSAQQQQQQQQHDHDHDHDNDISSASTTQPAASQLGNDDETAQNIIPQNLDLATASPVPPRRAFVHFPSSPPILPPFFCAKSRGTSSK